LKPASRLGDADWLRTTFGLFVSEARVSQRELVVAVPLGYARTVSLRTVGVPYGHNQD